MEARSGVITLTTDFGRRDAYAAALEARLIAGCPAARVVHVTHDVAPGDVLSGAYLVEYAARSFPPGTVHLAVVDPGVGGDRPIVALEAGGQLLVGPGNGVLERARRGLDTAAVRVRPRAEASATFESRDLMAPVAAALASGAALEEVGERIAIERVGAAPSLDTIAGAAQVAVAHVDRFGTVVLDVLVEAPLPVALRVEGIRVPCGRTFSDVASGELVAYQGSIGYLEAAVRDGSAAARLGLRVGDRVGLRVSDA